MGLYSSSFSVYTSQHTEIVIRVTHINAYVLRLNLLSPLFDSRPSTQKYQYIQNTSNNITSSCLSSNHFPITRAICSTCFQKKCHVYSLLSTYFIYTTLIYSFTLIDNVTSHYLCINLVYNVFVHFMVKKHDFITPLSSFTMLSACFFSQ